MRISPISMSLPQSKSVEKRTRYVNQPMASAINFRNGKHECAKFFGGLAGTLGTLGAIGGTIIMTGGVALPAVIAYGAGCTILGASIGHVVDKEAERKPEKDND